MDAQQRLLYIAARRPKGTEMADTAWIYEVFAAIEAKDGERVASFFAEDGYFEVPAVHSRE